jgi:hypothetical protein
MYVQSSNLFRKVCKKINMHNYYIINLVPCCYTLISNQLLGRKEINVEHILDLFSISLTKYGKQEVIHNVTLINNPNGRIKAHCTNTHHSPLGNLPYLYTYPPTLMQLQHLLY